MICKECGAYNSDRARFCKVCGASLIESAEDSVSEEKKVTVPEAETEETIEAEEPVRETEKATTRFSKKSFPVDSDEIEEEIDEDEEDVKPVKKGLFAKKPAKRPADEDEDEDDDEDEEDEEDVKPVKKGLFAKKPAKRPADEDEDEDDDEDEEDEEDVKPVKRGLFVKKPAKRPADEDEDDEDEDEDEEDEEEVKPVKKGLFAKKPAKRPADEDEDDEDDDEDEDEDEEDEEDVKVYSSKKKPTPAEKRHPSKEDEDDDDDDDEDDDDDYEEYESTPPRSKKNASGKKSNLLVILLAAIAVILVILIALVVWCNNDPARRQQLPSFLQFSACDSNNSEQTVLPAAAEAVAPASSEAVPEEAATPEPVQEYASESFDATAASMEEFVNDEGVECVKLKFYLMPGETMTAVLPNQDDMVHTNDQDKCIDIALNIPKDCYKPNAPLTSSEYVVTPVIKITAADGTVSTRDVGSFTMTFPEATLEITSPAEIPEEGIMCPEGNVLHIEGITNDHTVSVMANGQVLNVYADGIIKGDYVLPAEEAEDVTITVSGDNLVTASKTIRVLPYVFIPEPMELSVEGTAKDHKANTKKGTVTLTGKVSPGSDLVASCDYEDIKCGSVLVNADGSFSLEVVFGSNTYGMFSVNFSATQEGYENGELSTYVYRMFDDRKAFVNGFTKTKSYKELPSKVTYDELMADPSAYGGYRVTGKVVAVTEIDGFEIVQMDVQTSKKETKTMYILNMSSAWQPSANVGTSYKVYTTLNGLYTDGESLFLVGWFAMK